MSSSIVARNPSGCEFPWKRGVIGVESGVSVFPCLIGPEDECAYCHERIVWGMDRHAKPVALNEWDDNSITTTMHVNTCAVRRRVAA